jgi:hypothetical protein
MPEERQMMRRAWTAAALFYLGILVTDASNAQDPEPRFDVGLRGVVLLSKGEPANDMIGEGLLFRWRARRAWHIGIAFDAVTFDYETPNKALGIVSATVVDGTNDISRASLLVERRYDGDRSWDWYWLLGVGSASVDVPNVVGVRADGSTFDIATDADDEMHVFAGGGLRRPLGARWTLETTFTVEHHTTEYELVDQISGARGTIGAQSPYGIAIGVSYRF